MQANLTANRLPELPENCFYFVDNPTALLNRDGALARDLNPKRKRPSRARNRKGEPMPLSRAERVANLAWFYAACADHEELSPFDE